MLDFFEDALGPFTYIVDPSKRLFFIYVLSATVLAFLVLWFQEKSLKRTWQILTDAKVWKHPSTQIDIQLLLFNSVIRAVLFFFVVVSSFSVARSSVRFLNQLFPDYEPFDISRFWLITFYSVCSFLMLDFSRFFQHYLSHKWSFLWRFHKIHHSAPVLTPLTL